MKKTKKLLAVFAAVGVALMLPLQTMAAVDLNAKYDISTNQIQGWPAGPDITSDTGILMDADTGVVLYNKGGDEQRYPASITKIMTLLVAVENSTMDEKVTFTETGVRNVTADSSNIGTKVGEVLTMEECLHALIIQSANDVAAQIAEHIGGTEQAFIDMMNQRASEIGCTNTHFANSSGLPDDNHYSSARDMALIFRHILPNSIGPIITSSMIAIPTAIFSESFLAYIGLGLQAPEPSIGVMLSRGQKVLLQYPSQVVFPAIIISLLMISFNLFGNGLRDAFDPTLRGAE